MAESAARVHAVASEPVPAALVEPRALAVPELAISPLQAKVQNPIHASRTESKRESDQPLSQQTNQPTGGYNCSSPVEMHGDTRNGGGAGIGVFAEGWW